MPYEKLTDLPEQVKSNLPKHAQEIYKEAYNNAWDQYADPQKRRDQQTQEETAHRVAWAAVKNEYEKKGEEWVRK